MPKRKRGHGMGATVDRGEKVYSKAVHKTAGGLLRDWGGERCY